MNTSSALSRTLLFSGALSLFLPRWALRGVDGLASKSTFSYDKECEVDSGFYTLAFGSLRLESSSLILGEYNQCSGYSGDDTRDVSKIAVCDTITGEIGDRYFEDGTCTEVDYEEVAAPSCHGLSTPSGVECTDNFGVCSFVEECTDDVPATISSTVVNYFASEYNDADCTEPTGNTVVVAGESLVFGSYADECFKMMSGIYTISECRADGSVIAQFFTTDDDTCSGEVWSQVNTATEYSPPRCSPIAVDGMHYGYISCTTDAQTVWAGTTAPTIPPIPEDNGPTANTPAPTTDLFGEAAADTPAPATDVDDDAAAETPAPTSDGDIIAADSPAPTTDGDSAADTPAPAVDVEDEINDVDIPAPAGRDSRSISVTQSPFADSGSGEVEEATQPVESEEASVANGARGWGSNFAVASAVLSCAVGLLGLLEM